MAATGFLSDGDDLPTAPAIAADIVDASHTSNWSLCDIELAAMRDPAIATKFLRLANSTLFGSPGRVSTLPHALARLDFHIARVVALSFRFPNEAAVQSGFDFLSYWRFCLGRSLAANALARYFPEVNVDEARLLGLIADCGILILVERYGAMYVQAVDEARRSKVDVRVVEKDWFDQDHTSLTAELFRGWYFPEHLAQAVDCFESPEKIENAHWQPRGLAKTLYLANATQAIDRKSDPSSWIALVERWANVDNQRAESTVREILFATEKSQELYAEDGLSQKDVIAQAHRRIIDASLATATNLTLASRQAEESRKRADELQRQHDRLLRQVTADPLTGVGNRSFLDIRLNEELQRAKRSKRPLSVVLYDLDHFKKLNDTYGHLPGDDVLKATARAVRALLRVNDVLARYGGEEFVVIAPDTDAVGANSLAERIRECFEKLRIETHGHTLSITASFGVVTASDAEAIAGGNDLLSVADAALYLAKNAGRNCVRAKSVG